MCCEKVLIWCTFLVCRSCKPSWAQTVIHYWQICSSQLVHPPTYKREMHISLSISSFLRLAKCRIWKEHGNVQHHHDATDIYHGMYPSSTLAIPIARKEQGEHFTRAHQSLASGKERLRIEIVVASKLGETASRCCVLLIYTWRTFPCSFHISHNWCSG